MIGLILSDNQSTVSTRSGSRRHWPLRKAWLPVMVTTVKVASTVYKREISQAEQKRFREKPSGICNKSKRFVTTATRRGPKIPNTYLKQSWGA